MKIKFVIDSDRMDEMLAPGASSVGVRTVLIEAFKSLQEAGILIRSPENTAAEPRLTNFHIAKS